MASQTPKLLDQVRQALRVKHYAIRTEEAYVHWIKRFILFHHKRHPREMHTPEIEAFPIPPQPPKSRHRPPYPNATNRVNFPHP